MLIDNDIYQILYELDRHISRRQHRVLHDGEVGLPGLYRNIRGLPLRIKFYKKDTKRDRLIKVWGDLRWLGMHNERYMLRTTIKDSTIKSWVSPSRWNLIKMMPLNEILFTKITPGLAYMQNSPLFPYVWLIGRNSGGLNMNTINKKDIAEHVESLLPIEMFGLPIKYMGVARIADDTHESMVIICNTFAVLHIKRLSTTGQYWYGPSTSILSPLILKQQDINTLEPIMDFVRANVDSLDDLDSVTIEEIHEELYYNIVKMAEENILAQEILNRIGHNPIWHIMELKLGVTVDDIVKKHRKLFQ